jgi:hypothetical protein
MAGLTALASCQKRAISIKFPNRYGSGWAYSYIKLSFQFDFYEKYAVDHYDYGRLSMGLLPGQDDPGGTLETRAC